MAIGIDGVTLGVSRAGAENLKQKIRTDAIEATSNALSNTDNIRTTFEANWQGQSEVMFMQNFETKILRLKETLKSLEEACNSEIDNIVSSAISMDENLVEASEE